MLKNEIKIEIKKKIEKMDIAVKAGNWEEVARIRQEMRALVPIEEEEILEDEEEVLEDEEEEEYYEEEEILEDEEYKPYKSWEQRAFEDSGMTWKDFI